MRKLLVSGILMLLSFGCNNIEDGMNVIASEKVLPTNFQEIAFERQETPYRDYLVSKVVNESDFEEAWNLFNFEDDMPLVDFNEKAVFFIGLAESGSCPYNIKSMKQSSNNKSITVSLSSTMGPCTDDATRRTFVIEINKEMGKEIESVVIDEGRVETSVPLAKNL
ncbi:hypothetical protein [Cytobacillus sp. IB215665]|uniref:hypothetical protein n=1 Tax=Cytobacillus sp. IB215665 TaxID=3097357 RepID=UPI002A1775D6|nr:hypothetical protein [Cytobacillus sp. IB215665]MDX8363780.1 hypothetical protein [Cytobacillus sp. IB215665]